MGWKWGCQPFSCPCPLNVTHCRREICWTCKESIPAIPFGNSKHPLPTRSLRFLRAKVRSTSSALCLYYACKRSHPFVAAAGKTCLRQRSKRFGHRVVVSKICYVQYSDCVQDLDYRILIVLSVVRCDCCKRMNNCRDSRLSFLATVGWKWGCQPFSSPCSQNVTHFRKEICSTCLSKESIPAIPFGNTNHIPYQKLGVPESRSTFQQLCLMLASCTSSCIKKPVSCREAEGLVTELWSPKFVTMQ